MTKRKSKNKNRQTRVIRKEIRRQLATGQLVGKNEEDKTGKKKRKGKLVVVLTVILSLVTIVLAIVTLWLQTKPSLTVSSMTAVDTNDPLSTYFTISNNSVLALMDVRFEFRTDMIAGTNVFKNIYTSGNAGQQNVDKINPGQKITQTTGIKIDNFEGNAIIQIEVSYYPQYYPRISIFEKHSKFKFESVKTSNGYSWIEQPVD